ncbi:hypothetical protein C6N75_08355 [Streptomyces solincola]|uniref:Uncharacterized protein n=1 Tax=Streptomyces solincola TaxID=2100817 RepID=A0A2S9PYZ0_9ACTN|nr:hypothetical protein [Streptomyces solincola]PRH79641.1 hypothetical protein C6N75_08355 [Streptomyces solincola]
MDLGHDWKRASTFALAKVDGLVTVVGINPEKPEAQSLVVVPQQADDDDAVSPHIAHLADGRWILTVPRKNGKPDRRYEINRSEHTLDALTGDERLSRTLPGSSLLAEVAGLPDGKSPSGEPESSVLVKNPNGWTTTRKLKIPGTIDFAASDSASDTICLGSSSNSATKVSTVNLADGSINFAPVPAGLTVGGLACPAGHPVIAGSPARGTADEVSVALTRHPAATAITVDGGRLDAIAATHSSLVIAAAQGNDTELVEVNAATGQELHRARIKDLAASLNITHTASGWLVYAEDTVTRVNLTTGKTRQFALPGPLLAS